MDGFIGENNSPLMAVLQAMCSFLGTHNAGIHPEMPNGVYAIMRELVKAHLPHLAANECNYICRYTCRSGCET